MRHFELEMPDPVHGLLLAPLDIIIIMSNLPPDDGSPAVPAFQVTERYAEPPGRRMSRAEMPGHLLAQYGQKCQGCDRVFDDPRYLQLDHNAPRSEGGLNQITNRVLLCGSSNQLKSKAYTLTRLRRENRRRGFMATPR